MDGVSHTAEVTAATLYEAVVLGLAAIRGNKWVRGIAQGQNAVKGSGAHVGVEHEVRLMDFTKWLDRTGGSPREVTAIRSILGMAASRQVGTRAARGTVQRTLHSLPKNPLRRVPVVGVDSLLG